MAGGKPVVKLFGLGSADEITGSRVGGEAKGPERRGLGKLARDMGKGGAQTAQWGTGLLTWDGILTSELSPGDRGLWPPHGQAKQVHIASLIHRHRRRDVHNAGRDCGQRERLNMDAQESRPPGPPPSDPGVRALNSSSRKVEENLVALLHFGEHVWGRSWVWDESGVPAAASFLSCLGHQPWVVGSDSIPTAWLQEVQVDGRVQSGGAGSYWQLLGVPRSGWDTLGYFCEKKRKTERKR